MMRIIAAMIAYLTAAPVSDQYLNKRIEVSNFS
jgi:hypothetical protein